MQFEMSVFRNFSFRRIILFASILVVGSYQQLFGQVFWNHAVAGEGSLGDLQFMVVDSSTYLLTGQFIGEYVWNEGSNFPSIGMSSPFEFQEFYRSGFVAFLNTEGEMYDIWQFDPPSPTLNNIGITPIQMTDSDVVYLMFNSGSNTLIDLDPDTLSTVSQLVSSSQFVIATYDIATGDLLEVSGTAGGWYAPSTVCDSETGFILNYTTLNGWTTDITFTVPEITISGNENFAVIAKYNDNFELQWHHVVGLELNTYVSGNFLVELNDGRVVWHVSDLQGEPGVVIDLDPGAAIDPLESGGSAMLVYDANGNYEGSLKNVEWIESMEQVGENDIRFFGSVTGTVDIDPSQNELLFNSYTNNADVVEVSVDGEFNLNWYRSMRGTSPVTAGIADMGSPTSTLHVNADAGSFDGDISNNGFRLFENQSSNFSLLQRVDDSGNPLSVVELNGAGVVIPTAETDRCLIIQDHNLNPSPLTVNGVTYGLNTQISDEGWQFVMLSLGEYSSIQGRVFSDDNGNGLWDVDEGPFFQQTTISSPEVNRYVNVDTSGSYLFTLDPDDYSLDINLPDYRSVSTGQSFPIVVSLPEDTIIALSDIGVVAQQNVTDLAADVAVIGALQPGFTRALKVTVGNSGTTVANGQLVLKIPPFITPSQIVPTPSLMNGDSIVWNTSMLEEFDSQEFDMLLTVEPDVSLIGDTATFLAHVTTLQPDANSGNNFSQRDIVVVGSYDPNDKRVFPATTDVGSNVANGLQPLSYIIRFQNTGNFPTSFVHIVDTIPDDLDLGTFRMISSSHPCEFQIGMDRVITWSFDPLVLPDSASDPEGSIGYIEFTIARDAQHPYSDGTVENRAFIYFDFNPPIITNWSVFEILDWNSVRSYMTSNELKLLVYPNPSNEVVNISYKTSPNEKPVVHIVDMVGQHVETVELSSHEGTRALSVSNLESGTYLCRLVINNTAIAAQRFVVVGSN